MRWLIKIVMPAEVCQDSDYIVLPGALAIFFGSLEQGVTLGV